jgi:hypothetical protein
MYPLFYPCFFGSCGFISGLSQTCLRLKALVVVVVWLLMVSSIAYPNLLGLKGFVVVVKITIYRNIAIIQQVNALLFTKASIFTFFKKH